jgi:hypothetical protein
VRSNQINVIYCLFILTVMKLILLQWKSASTDSKSPIFAFTNTAQPSRQEVVRTASKNTIRMWGMVKPSEQRRSTCSPRNSTLIIRSSPNADSSRRTCSVSLLRSKRKSSRRSTLCARGWSIKLVTLYCPI